MQRLIVFLIVTSLGWYGYATYQGHVKESRVLETKGGSLVLEAKPAPASATVPTPAPEIAPAIAPKAETPTAVAFTCDGRTYCSQMTSCAEATFFLKNCPGTKMDGDNDGIPCEAQWCK